MLSASTGLRINSAKHLSFSSRIQREIHRLAPQDDLETQSVGEEEAACSDPPLPFSFSVGVRKLMNHFVVGR